MQAVQEKSGENDAFWEANPRGVPIAALFGTQGGAGEVGTQIRKADADTDGYLNKAEFRQAIAETLRQARENKSLKGAVLALVISVVVLTATVCGGVYGIVESAKDTESHEEDAALYIKNMDSVVRTEQALYEDDVMDVDMSQFTQADLEGVDRLTMTVGDADIDMEVSAWISKPNSTTFMSPIGEITFMADGDVEVTGKIVNFLKDELVPTGEEGRHLLNRRIRWLNRRLMRRRQVQESKLAGTRSNCFRGRCGKLRNAIKPTPQ